MITRSFTQGEDGLADFDLFGLIGHWLTDKVVHERLGSALITAKGDFWFVAVNEQNSSSGFVTGRILKGGAMHLRFVYSVVDAVPAYSDLIRSAIAHAKANDCKTIWTNDRETAKVWAKLGFISTPRARGDFVRWEKSLEDK